jgi:queuine tRNA-ribosyltransferase
LHTDGARPRPDPHAARRGAPAFMPVGTGRAQGRALHSARAGADIVLGNTYHLMRPGAGIAALGGLHRFVNWPHHPPD